MNDFNTDPAAEIKRLKAQEKAKLNPAAWPAPVKAKKWPQANAAKKKWPAAPDWSKLKKARPQVWRPLVEDVEYAPWQQGGVSRSEIIHALFYIAGALLFILLTEVL